MDDGARLPGAFGRKANAPTIWILLCALFVLPFPRPPLRLLHLDLTVLVAFSISYALFGAARIHVGPGRLPAARLPAGAHAGGRSLAREAARRAGRRWLPTP